MTAAAMILLVGFAYFAGKHRGRGEGFAQGWLVGMYQARIRR
jgi:hypothetical protein